MAGHVISTDHMQDWLGQHYGNWLPKTFTHLCCTMESWHIHKEEGALNKKKGILPDVYLYTIDEVSCITTDIKNTYNWLVKTNIKQWIQSH